MTILKEQLAYKAANALLSSQYPHENNVLINSHNLTIYKKTRPNIDDDCRGWKKQTLQLIFFWPTNQSTCFLEIFKVDVNAKHNLGWTPLMVAAMNGHFVAVKTLLDAKANPNIPDSYSQAG